MYAGALACLGNDIRAYLLAIDLSEERCAEGHIDVDVVVALLFAVVGIEGGVDATTPLPTLWDGSFC